MDSKTVLVICDMWDNHWCADLRQRTESLVHRIDDFAAIVRRAGGRVLHCPSGLVNTYYAEWSQRTAMKRYPDAGIAVSQEMRSIQFPLNTTWTAGCPDIPPCHIHTSFEKQHDGIQVLPEDLISENGQEIYNFFSHQNISRVLMAGAALNMCVLARPFGVEAMAELGLDVRVVSDLVEVFYSPLEPPYITIEQAKWFALGYVEAKWCPITTCYAETITVPKDTNMNIHTNLPGQLLAQLKDRHLLKSFVEAKTASGDTTELAAIVFDQVWSCDIDPRRTTEAGARLKDYIGVNLLTEASPDCLRRIKPQIAQPALYWLDTHWSNSDTSIIEECPLLSEIEAIGSLGKSIILIDHIELLDEPPPLPHDPTQWPSMQELRAMLDVRGEPYSLDWHQGPKSRILIITPGEQA